MITFSVPIAGVLLVFSFLVVPAADRLSVHPAPGNSSGDLLAERRTGFCPGLWVSFHYDLPTGPVIVCMFGLVLLGAYLARRLAGSKAPTLASTHAEGTIQTF